MGDFAVYNYIDLFVVHHLGRISRIIHIIYMLKPVGAKACEAWIRAAAGRRHVPWLRPGESKRVIQARLRFASSQRFNIDYTFGVPYLFDNCAEAILSA